MLKVTFLLSIIILLIPVFCYGQVSQSQANAPIAQEWNKLEFKECGFSALLPTKPQENDVKGQITTHVFMSTVGSDHYVVKCAKYNDKLEDPLKIQELLNNIRSQIVGSIGGRILDEKRMAFGGFRGREVKIEVKGYYVTARLIWVKQWLYQLFTEIPVTNNRSVEQQRFFDSFALDGYPKSVATITNSDTDNAPTRLSEGVIKGKAIKLVTPPFPMLANGKVNTTILVNILIDERGHVISATADSGDPVFVRAAVDAAKASIFAPTLFGGVAVKVQGVLTYHFRR